MPNAQHAVRQAKLLAKNLVAVLRGELPREYFHKNLGAVAGLGLYNGVFQSGNLALKGIIAWVAHRGYHGLAMPSWERKFRVLWGWWNNLWLRRDIVNLQAVQDPRYVFEEFAARPRPPQPVEAAAPAKVDGRAGRAEEGRRAQLTGTVEASALRARPRSPTGRGRRLKIASVRVRIPAGVRRSRRPQGGAITVRHIGTQAVRAGPRRRRLRPRRSREWRGGGDESRRGYGAQHGDRAVRAGPRRRTAPPRRPWRACPRMAAYVTPYRRGPSTRPPAP